MTAAAIGSISVRSADPIPLYTTTTNQFDKTVFTGNASPFTVILPTVTTNNATNIAYNATTGVYSLDAGVTYQLLIEGTISNYNSATPAKFQWINAANGSTVGPALPIGSTLVTTFKSGSASTIKLTAVAGSAPFDYPAQLDNNMRAIVQVVSGWQQ